MSVSKRWQWLKTKIAAVPIWERWLGGSIVAVIVLAGIAWWWWLVSVIIAVTVLAGTAWWWAPKWQMKSITAGDPKARADIEDNFRKTIGQALGGIAVLFGAVAAYLQFTQQQNAAHDLLISNRIAKGFEQLGSPELVVRLGGIYSLEGVMNGSPQYHQPVLEALCAFVRAGTIGIVINDEDAPATDIQAALTVIGRRDPGPGVVNLTQVKIPHAQLIHANLVGADLSRAYLSDAHLSRANLREADLREADLREAHLQGADLRDAHLNDARLIYAHLSIIDLRGAYLLDANLSGTDLSGAFLTGANLNNADLSHTDLSDARLSRANLIGAHLSDTDLNRADLSDAALNGQAQLDQACGQPAHLPDGLKLDKPCPSREARPTQPPPNR